MFYIILDLHIIKLSNLIERHEFNYIVCVVLFKVFIFVALVLSKTLKLPEIYLVFHIKIGHKSNELNFNRIKETFCQKRWGWKWWTSVLYILTSDLRCHLTQSRLNWATLRAIFYKFWMTSVENMHFKRAFSKNIYRSGFIDKRTQALFVSDERRQKIKWNVSVLL